MRTTTVYWSGVCLCALESSYNKFGAIDNLQGKKMCADKEPIEFVPTGGLGNATGKWLRV